MEKYKTHNKRTISSNFQEMVANSWPAPEFQTVFQKIVSWLTVGTTAVSLILTLLALFFKIGANAGHAKHIAVAIAITIILGVASIHTFIGPMLKRRV